MQSCRVQMKVLRGYRLVRATFAKHGAATRTATAISGGGILMNTRHKPIRLASGRYEMKVSIAREGRAPRAFYVTMNVRP